MTLRALVMVEHTGLQAPNFLGFLGPYDWPSLEVVAPVTNVFGLTHVVPYNRGPQIDNVLPVVSQDNNKSVIAAIALINHLQWAAVLLVDTGDKVTSDNIVNLAQDHDICIMTASLQYPNALRQGNLIIISILYGLYTEILVTLLKYKLLFIRL